MSEKFIKLASFIVCHIPIIFPIAWTIIWYISAFSNIGSAGNPEEIFTLWDSIWVPSVITIFPVYIGYAMKEHVDKIKKQ